jgi:hypothetical protein
MSRSTNVSSSMPTLLDAADFTSDQTNLAARQPGSDGDRKM